jgi:hypothetical protein
LDDGAETSTDEHAFQLSSIDDKRLTEQTEAARLVEQGQSRRGALANMDNQWEFADSRRRLASWTLREALPNVRIQDEGIAR